MRIVIFLVLMISGVTSSTAQNNTYITLKGRQFIDRSGNPFFPMVMNYHLDLVYDQLGTPTFKVIRSTAYGTIGCNLEGGHTFSNCESSLVNDFNKIQQLGFNTIRITGALTPRRNNGALGFNTNAGIFNFDNNNGPTFCDPLSKIDFNMISPYTDADTQLLLNLLSQFLDLAYQHNMNVILLCTDGSGSYTLPNGDKMYFTDRGSSLVEANDYAEYLSQLAFALKDKPALLAYDIYNEPTFMRHQNGRNMDKNKDTICSYVGLWYDAIKASDTNHLITLGGTDFNDVLAWDTGVMKLDFVSVHIYPYPDDFGLLPANSAVYWESLVNQFHWFSQALGKPWIIGETGFSSSNETCLNSILWGDESEQLSYINYLLPNTRNCMGSGFSWWLFQDLHWFCVPDIVCNPTCNLCSSCNSLETKDVIQNYFGITRYSDPDPITGLYDPSDSKSAAQATINFAAGLGTPTIVPCEAPTTHYYDPFQNQNLNSNTSTYLTGSIRDQEGNLIKNAVALALNWLYTYDPDDNILGDEEYYHNWIYSVSNENTTGDNITIIPYSPFNPADPRIVYMKVSATGASKVELGDSWPWEDVAMNPNLGIITLNKINFNYDSEVENTTITSTSIQQNYMGWNTLSLKNTIVENGVISKLFARSDVLISREFHAEHGSDVHIYLSEAVFPDCNDYSGFLRIADNKYENSSSEETTQVQSITITFSETQNTFAVTPNPSSGIFKVNYKGLCDSEMFVVTVRNSMGQIVFKSTNCINNSDLDLRSNTKGVYYLEIKNGSNHFNKKLILI